MNEHELRALVRATIARMESAGAARDPRAQEPVPVLMHFAEHASHYRYALQPGGGPCQIEPGVRCEHCGYCESHGH